MNRLALLLMLAFMPLAQAAKLINPGFESGDFKGWAMSGENWRISTWKDDQRRGAYGAVTDVFTNNVTDEYRVIAQDIKASPGKYYKASVWIRAVCAESTESFLEVQFQNKEGETLQQFQSAVVKKDQDFTQMIIPCMQAPEGTEKACVKGVVHIIRMPTVNTDWQIFDNFDFDVVKPVQSPRSKVQ
jgi:hypothetical protein